MSLDETENLVALGRSVREGGVLKFANFEKVRFLAPPSGTVRQHSPELSINLNTASGVLLGFQKSELPVF